MDNLKSLMEGIQSDSKLIRNQAFKKLTDLAEENAAPFKEYIDLLLSMLGSRENRVQWEVMTLLSGLAPHYPQALFNRLEDLLAIAENGSVITRDHFVKILAVLSHHKKYKETTQPLLVDEVFKAPLNQLAMYAEVAAGALDENYRQYLKNAIMQRLVDVEEFPAKKARLVKVWKNL